MFISAYQTLICGHGMRISYSIGAEIWEYPWFSLGLRVQKPENRGRKIRREGSSEGLERRRTIKTRIAVAAMEEGAAVIEEGRLEVRIIRVQMV